MECESCGRYRPSAEITPLRDEARRLVMICARCRRISTARRGHVTAVPSLSSAVLGVPPPTTATS